jgi:hypothetical protein
MLAPLFHFVGILTQSSAGNANSRRKALTYRVIIPVTVRSSDIDGGDSSNFENSIQHRFAPPSFITYIKGKHTGTLTARDYPCLEN